MKIKRQTQTLYTFFFAFVVSIVFTGCATNQIQNSATNKYAGKSNAVSELSHDGRYRFTLYSARPEIPLGKIHEWIVRVETRDGEPVTNARLFVFGGMPAHRHGFPTKPRVKQHLGNGEYKVEGIKFTMPGAWEMRFNIKHNKVSERVVFKIDLK